MKRHLRYLSYVVRHKWFVLLAGLIETGAPLWRLVIHDWSKFTPGEWGPYVAEFYGESPDTLAFEWYQRMRDPTTSISHEDNEALKDAEQAMKAFIVDSRKEAFDRAWLHHQNANPHHWQHWLLRLDDGPTIAFAMPEHFAREMVADWMGAGRAITGRWEVAKWYAKQRDTIVLHEHTRTLVDRLIREVTE